MASGAFASAGLVRRGRGRILEIDTRKLLPVVIAHDEARFLFLRRSTVAGSDGALLTHSTK